MPGIRLRKYQEDAIRSIYEYFNKKQGNPLICMPTASGKSVIPAYFMWQALCNWPNLRFLLLTHVKELIVQNAKKMDDIWPTAPIGIFSSGLNRKDYAQSIIYAGIQSIHRQAPLLGHRDVVFIDECHLLNPNQDSMYQKTLAQLKHINPYLKVIGLTATPYRLKNGHLAQGENALFTDVCFDNTQSDDFVQLIRDGYLAMLIPKRTDMQVDLSEVKIKGGEFEAGSLQAATDKEKITLAAVKECVAYGQNRKKWLFFATGIEHSIHVAETLKSFGISAAAVHSKMKSAERDQVLHDHKSGRIRAVVSKGILTTGYDDPEIDLIADLAATQSPGLHVQKMGRGTRPSPGKDNCIVLDFAGNTARLGPINDPIIPGAKRRGTGDIPVRICPECGTYNHSSARECIGCGAEFKFQIKFRSSAHSDELIRTDEKIINLFQVDGVHYSRHQRNGSPASMKVTYQCGKKQFFEWVPIEHPKGKFIATKWFQEHFENNAPETVEQALNVTHLLKKPKRIRVHTNKAYPEVLGREY